VTEENVQSLLPAANLLQLTDVRDACCDFLQAQLHPTNCLGIRRYLPLSETSISFRRVTVTGGPFSLLFVASFYWSKTSSLHFDVIDLLPYRTVLNNFKAVSYRWNITYFELHFLMLNSYVLFCSRLACRLHGSLTSAFE
jgi:hypothetical protein